MVKVISCYWQMGQKGSSPVEDRLGVVCIGQLVPTSISFTSTCLENKYVLQGQRLLLNDSAFKNMCLMSVTEDTFQPDKLVLNDSAFPNMKYM